MTESQWLTSVDPAEMWRHVEATATQEQCRAFVLGCRHQWPPIFPGLEDDPITTKTAEGWANSSPTISCTEETKAPRCGILRCVFGNPWRTPVKIKNLGLAMPVARVHDSVEYQQIMHELDWQRIVRWNDGTVPKLARQVRGGAWVCKCGQWDDCKDGSYPPRCKTCGGAMQPSPDWSALPLLCEAMLDADERLYESELWRHLAGWARCPVCVGDGKRIVHQEADGNHGWIVQRATCTTCSGTGWVRCEAGHVARCWVLELLIEGESR